MTEMLDEKERRTVLGILAPYLHDPRVLRMKKYIQHGRITTYEHSLAVAFKCFEIVRDLRLRVDLHALLVAALLHDFYLYDWHEKDASHKWNGYHHAERARDNAARYFGVSDEVGGMIYSHMWPLNLTHTPKSKEAWVLTLADKLCSAKETLFLRKTRKGKQDPPPEEPEP